MGSGQGWTFQALQGKHHYCAGEGCCLGTHVYNCTLSKTIAADAVHVVADDVAAATKNGGLVAGCRLVK